MKNFLVSFIFFLPFWFLLNGSVAIEYTISGIIVLLFLAVWSTYRFPVFGTIRLSPQSFFAIFVLILVFIRELFKSNIDVAIRVLSPSLPINPGIVAVKTKLTDPVARFILANLITLTPGTLTLETHEDTFFIHWIDAGNTDADQNSAGIVQTFETYLEKIYG